MIVDQITAFLGRGGPAMWVIAGLSVITVAMILWKLWQLAMLGAWRRAPMMHALAALEAPKETTSETPEPERKPDQEAQERARAHLRKDLRSRVARAALDQASAEGRSDTAAREETTRIARAALGQTQSGLRTLELISVIAPLVGLLGTVLGMIDAFQALQEAGNRADPAALAGGIWQALLTTAAGMAVAIPASAALSWFEGMSEAIRSDLEDAAIRIFGLFRGGR